MIGPTNADKTQATKTKKRLFPQVSPLLFPSCSRPPFQKITINRIAKLTLPFPLLFSLKKRKSLPKGLLSTSWLPLLHPPTHYSTKVLNSIRFLPTHFLLSA